MGMNSDDLNKMHADVLQADLECTKLADQLEAHAKRGDELDIKFRELSNTWHEMVLALGTALAKSKLEYGRGWKRDFSTLGFDFSYVTACRYISCAAHPEARDEVCSIEEWATAAAEIARAANKAMSKKEADRKERATRRKVREIESTSHVCSTASAPINDAQERVSDDLDDFETRASVAFRFLHEAIENADQYSALRVPWETLVTALRAGKFPLVGVESPISEDDTVDSGESPQIDDVVSSSELTDFPELRELPLLDFVAG